MAPFHDPRDILVVSAGSLVWSASKRNVAKYTHVANLVKCNS
jgi:hypothetical protein